MQLRYKILAVVCLLGAFFLLGRCNRRAVTVPKPSAVLPKNDKETVTFNEKTHLLTVVTSSVTIREYAKNPEVEIRKDGTVKVDRHLVGFENSLFLGAGYADTGRIFLGDNLLHFGRFDLMGAIGWTPDNQYPAIKAYAGVSYNLYSNTSVGVCLNPVSIAQSKGIEIGGFLSVRL